ncbi:MAG: alpha/beta hydrolase [Gemmatimonadaceae bacterium]|nr:alpha/beta hydrolase [Gemmatimonadaceae bacterium]
MPVPRRAAARRRATSAVLLTVALAVGASDASAQAPSRAADAHERARELVVVAHGMGRSPISMWPLTKALEAAGYDVMNFGYSSYCCTIAEIGEQLRRELADNVRPYHTKVHFVGHSLGNIVIRYVLTRDTLPPRVGRVVMLAPPNQGANAANTFSPFTGWLLKPVAELRADSTATVRKLPRVQGVEIGVIAARDDRTVKLPETHLAEESAHLVVGGGHSFIMRREDVKQQVVAFLRTGQFLSGPIETDEWW